MTRDRLMPDADMSPARHAALDRDLRFVDVSDGFAALFGLPAAQLVGARLDGLPAPFAAALEPLLRQAVVAGEALGPTPLAGGPGCLVSCSPLRTRAGSVLGVEVVAHAGQAPPASPAHPDLDRGIFDQAPIGVLIADTAGRLLDANPALCQITGYGRDELLGLAGGADAQGDERALLADIFADEQAGRAAIRRYRRKDGSLIWVQVTRSLLRGPDGAARLGLAFVEDITAQMQATQALRRSEATFAAAFTYGPVLLAITRLSDGRITQVNERFLSTFGYTREEAIGRTPIELSLWVDPEMRSRGLRDLITGELLREIEADFRVKDGSIRTCLLFATMLEVDGERSVLTALTDITERRRAEAERERLALENARLYADEQRARGEAERAVRLRDEFLSIASHELRTPLTALLGNVQILQRRDQREGLLGERDRARLATIAEQVQRLSRMISQLLDITQIAAEHIRLDLAPLDMAAVVRQVVAELRPTLGRHRLALDLPDGPAPLAGDELRLTQVVTNLMQNAIKYSPPGREIAIALREEAGQVRLTVADQGIGIPQADLPRLFERYYRAPNAGGGQVGGMGIGLYVVKQVVERHGGSVTAESAEGQGSRFTVVLPRGALPETRE